MIIKARLLQREEQLLLTFGQDADNLDAYILERILKMSQKGWDIENIALALDLQENEVLKTIEIFNHRGLEPLLPTLQNLSPFIFNRP
ncbi:MAG TPA: helix-turn-helix domain-containing protein [Anaerolineales bacterium]|nr:helix-turn-helix domain-containing protein [Anaerolineales bacterium]